MASSWSDLFGGRSGRAAISASRRRFPLAVAGLEFFEISKISFGARGRFWSALTVSTFVALALLHRFNDSIGCDDTLGTHALPLVCLFVC